MYDSAHAIWPVAGNGPLPVDFLAEIENCELADVVGPICESSDYLAKNRWLPTVDRGDLLCTFSAGAYGMAMSSNYNARGRGAEVLVRQDTHRLIRRRETWDDLIEHER